MFANLKAYKTLFGCLNVYASLSQVPLCFAHPVSRPFNILIFGKPSSTFGKDFVKPFPKG